MDLINGHPTGSVRISFGYASTHQDAHNFLDFIKRCFVDCHSELKVSLSVTLCSTQKCNLTLPGLPPSNTSFDEFPFDDGRNAIISGLCLIIVYQQCPFTVI